MGGRASQRVANGATSTKLGSIPVSAGQLYRFVQEMKMGDAVILPLKRSPEIWLGEVKGNHTYPPNISWDAFMKWLGNELVPSQEFLQEFAVALAGKHFTPEADLQTASGSFLSFREPKQKSLV